MNIHENRTSCLWRLGKFEVSLGYSKQTNNNHKITILGSKQGRKERREWTGRDKTELKREKGNKVPAWDPTLHYAWHHVTLRIPMGYEADINLCLNMPTKLLSFLHLPILNSVYSLWLHHHMTYILHNDWRVLISTCLTCLESEDCPGPHSLPPTPARNLVPTKHTYCVGVLSEGPKQIMRTGWALAWVCFSRA